MRTPRLAASIAAGVATAGLLATPAQADVVEIADIQGTGSASPLVGQTVTTRGVVTAAYPTGGFNGIYLQTAGTGGPAAGGTQHRRRHAERVRRRLRVLGVVASDVGIGDHVEVTGRVRSTGPHRDHPTAGSWPCSTTAEPVKPAEVDFPPTRPAREPRGHARGPTGRFTITNNYSTNQYAEIGLAAGGRPLPQPTNVARPLSAEYDEVVAENARAARDARRRCDDELPQLGQPGRPVAVAAP